MLRPLTFGCISHMCPVSASYIENMFISVHSWQRNLCLRRLRIVSSYFRKGAWQEKIVLYGLPMDGLILANFYESGALL